MRQYDYVDILVKRPVKITLHNSMRYGETYGQAIMRLINFYNAEIKKAEVISPGLNERINPVASKPGVQHD